MKKWMLRVASTLVTAILAVGILAWLTLRASLPQLDGELVVAGIGAVAAIERDADGITTISATTRGDVAFATGFTHAQDRFFQMDLIRRQSAGELSELLGEAMLEYDRRVRLHRFRARAGKALMSQPAQDLQLLERYADGVNAGLANLGAKPFEYYLLGVDPESWAAEDTVLVAYTMFLMLNDERADRDLKRGLAHRVLPAEVFAFMYPEGTSWDAPLMGDVRQQPPIPSADVVSVRELDEQSPSPNEIAKPDLPGSNNWVVSGALTGTGAAMVSNDMHLGLRVPAVWYQARLVVEGSEPRDVTGVTLPGTPFVIGGSNSRIAWGNTNSYGDWSDAVVLQPGSRPNTYRSGGADLPFDEIIERIDVRGGESIELVVRETIWGPVHDDVDYPDGEIAIRWIAHDIEALNLNLAGLETAASVEEALDIANAMGGPPQNFVVGDDAGNVGWTIAGRIPVRTGYEPTLPADWSDGAGWSGWLDPAQVPRIVNPENGRIWTANARVADGEALRIIGDSGYDLGARARQIRDALMQKDRFGANDMLAIQIDDRALFLSRWRDLLLDEVAGDDVAGDARLGEYRRLVEDWIPRAVPESVGYRLVRSFRLEVQSRLFHALTAPARAEYGEDVDLRLSNQFEGPLWTLVSERPEHLLPGRYDDWHELFVDAVRSSIRYFEVNYGDALADRTWGERNMASIRHPLSGALPILGGFLNMPAEPLAGDVDLPRAQGRTFGASQRFSVAPGDEANGIMHMPTGQSGHPLSDFYGKGHDDWVRGTPSPFLPGETRHKLLLMPDK
ncbi:MAG: penicillin acylase family protein [Woeseiaceae bacterium]|nr:penicillin acylase family protein [Woeseiaceae bacterium]NIP21249.1 penicillin acylase family protein [Woeseiaceae bacterium]NIS90221.1 penicillin acylase family protein [Woeseiaceae bacterium]